MKLSPDIFDRIAEIWQERHRAARRLPRQGKHRAGHRGGSHYRKDLRAARKRQRQARRRARLIRAGRKHRR